MRTSILFATLSAFALAQAATTTTDNGNPATQYLTETNSNGVVTGQPEVVTSQPAVVTSEPAVVTSQQPAASIPAGLSTPAAGEPGTTSTTMTSVKSNTQTISMVTVSSATQTGTQASSNSNSNSQSASASASATHTTNAAPLATAGSLGLPSNLRRLAADHAALHSTGLPPYYLLPPSNESTDDLSQLTVLLTGPPGTPYSQGLWRLHLRMPEDYPHSPPKATFKTRIWHPNMEELTGAVCVDTLKRDWQPKLTLKDVLVTISCLLIHPNPDSALNSTAGAMLQEDYNAFAHQARLMTSIHAPISTDLKDAVTEAKLRGEDAGAVFEEKDNTNFQRPRKEQRIQTVTMKKTVRTTGPTQESAAMPEDDDSENEDPASASKENDPSLSPTPVRLAPPSPRKNALGKRPLSSLPVPYPEDLDSDMMLVDEDEDIDSPCMSSSEQNIQANTSRSGSPQRKQVKLSLLNRGLNASSRVRDDLQIYEDVPELSTHDASRRLSGDGKENPQAVLVLKEKCEMQTAKTVTPLSAGSAPTRTASSLASSAAPSKVSKVTAGVRKVSSGAGKPKPRIGVRRL
ncbi:Ubiquitin-conjugating enzyme E2 [Penicillium lagena]|uniref:Ubiquitin-conjugating enzyme E2 n=1 Tax=Penicillium lagena TaxID=94218 RepID=UPI0025414CA6|nr:Ubiquitin-conjugating enzyme E2 [Penicillium lagena]KAJ5620008.1 Ubiquitin-conjugating enzyme E2 [Penicillium lagena]